MRAEVGDLPHVVQELAEIPVGRRCVKDRAYRRRKLIASTVAGNPVNPAGSIDVPEGKISLRRFKHLGIGEAVGCDTTQLRSAREASRPRCRWCCEGGRRDRVEFRAEAGFGDLTKNATKKLKERFWAVRPPKRLETSLGLECGSPLQRTTRLS
jgi:hypothetical protein